jgi:hypothetical protein
MAFFFDRDRAFIALFLAPLTALGAYAAHRWHRYELFMEAHPEVRRTFERWKPVDPRVCPTHGMYVPRGKSCGAPGCEWHPPAR